MKTITIIIALALSSCGVVESVKIHGRIADYEIDFVEPAK